MTRIKLKREYIGHEDVPYQFKFGRIYDVADDTPDSDGDYSFYYRDEDGEEDSEYIHERFVRVVGEGEGEGSMYIYACDITARQRKMLAAMSDKLTQTDAGWVYYDLLTNSLIDDEDYPDDQCEIVEFGEFMEVISGGDCLDVEFTISGNVPETLQEYEFLQAHIKQIIEETDWED